MLNNKKGVAGTNVVIQLMIAVFIIGLLGMIIAITGASMFDATGYDRTGASALQSDALTGVTTGAYVSFAHNESTDKSALCSVVAVQNTTGGKVIGSGNYTTNNCVIKSATATFNGTDWTANYTYTYEKPNVAGEIINGTTEGIKDVPDNFKLWLVVGGLVVVIGLIAFVIITLRGTGMMGA